eukprot:763527-Hanusia_phi.AAC.6
MSRTLEGGSGKRKGRVRRQEGGRKAGGGREESEGEGEEREEEGDGCGEGGGARGFATPSVQRKAGKAAWEAVEMAGEGRDERGRKGRGGRVAGGNCRGLK